MNNCHYPGETRGISPCVSVCVCLKCDFLIISNCAEHYMNSNAACVCVSQTAPRWEHMLKILGLIFFFFWVGSYISNRSINQNTARSCENPLTETDGGIRSFCIPEMVQISESSCSILYWRLSDEYPVYCIKKFLNQFVNTVFFSVSCSAPPHNSALILPQQKKKLV